MRRWQAIYDGQGFSPAEARERVRSDLRTNLYDPSRQVLTFTPGQTFAFGEMERYYRTWFGPPDGQQGLRRPHLRDPAEVRQVTAYFSWAAWVTAATRPGTDYSYTNNWPPDEIAGNKPTAEALVWSVLSLVALLGGTGLVLIRVRPLRVARLASRGG